MKYVILLKANVQVTKFQYRRSNFYYNLNCILEGLLHRASKKGEQAKTGREQQKE